VRLHHGGVRQFRHPAVGVLDLKFEAMALEADDGLALTAYTAEPGKPPHDGLRLLASWPASQTGDLKDQSRLGPFGGKKILFRTDRGLLLVQGHDSLGVGDQCLGGGRDPVGDRAVLGRAEPGGDLRHVFAKRAERLGQ
jgi:hypothetical protein